MPSISSLSIRSLYESLPSWSYYNPFPTRQPTPPPPPTAPPTPPPSPPISLPVPPPLPPDPLLAMRRELDHAKNELSKARSDASRLSDRCAVLEKTLKDTRELLRLRDHDLDKLRKASRHPDRRRSDAGTAPPVYKPPHLRNRDSFTTHSDLGPATTNGRSHHRHTSSVPAVSLTPAVPPTPISLSDCTRALELAADDEERARIRAHDTYSARIDAWSGAQVLQAVHDLNSEILQFAASAADLCLFDRDSRPSASRAVQAMHDTSARQGPNLARIISSRDHSQDPILVQLALQGCVSTAIVQALAAFCIGFSPKPDSVLAHIYAKMLLTESQPTSSKWRSLTHRHIHASYPQLAENAVNDLSDTILRWCHDIFIIAGCTSYETSLSSSSTSSLSSLSSKDGLRHRFGEQIRRIAKAAVRLARVTREEIMSTSFDLVAVTESEAFDPSSMSDPFADYADSRGAVIATTELGLRCITRVHDPELEGADPDVDPSILQKRLILQPKVVLESVLDVLDPRS